MLHEPDSNRRRSRVRSRRTPSGLPAIVGRFGLVYRIRILRRQGNVRAFPQRLEIEVDCLPPKAPSDDDLRALHRRGHVVCNDPPCPSATLSSLPSPRAQSGAGSSARGVTGRSTRAWPPVKTPWRPLSSSPRAHRALVGCGLWAGSQTQGQLRHSSSSGAWDQLRLLPDPQPLADLCDEAGHRASLRRFAKPRGRGSSRTWSQAARHRVRWPTPCSSPSSTRTAGVRAFLAAYAQP
jgi:hypothetical protein